MLEALAAMSFFKLIVLCLTAVFLTSILGCCAGKAAVDVSRNLAEAKKHCAEVQWLIAQAEDDHE